MLMLARAFSRDRLSDPRASGFEDSHLRFVRVRTRLRGISFKARHTDRQDGDTRKRLAPAKMMTGSILRIAATLALARDNFPDA